MPNKNYLRGRRFEYERKKAWEASGCKVIRASGSHGFADLVAFHPAQRVAAIQCKVVSSVRAANALVKKFEANPPLGRDSAYVNQIIEVKVKGKIPIWHGSVLGPMTAIERFFREDE